MLTTPNSPEEPTNFEDWWESTFQKHFNRAILSYRVHWAAPKMEEDPIAWAIYACSTCYAIGWEIGDPPQICETCDGTGRAPERNQHRLI